MSAVSRLDEQERARLLGLIGIDRYVRRRGLAPAPEEASAPARASRAAAAADAAPASRPAAPEFEPATSGTTRPSLLDELGADARAPRVLLLVETTRAPDPRVKPLLDAIKRSLPAHQTLDASDSPARWPEFVIALGGRATPPAGTRLIQCLPLHALRGNAGAKRELWRSLKAVLRATRRS